VGALHTLAQQGHRDCGNGDHRLVIPGARPTKFAPLPGPTSAHRRGPFDITIAFIIRFRSDPGECDSDRPDRLRPAGNAPRSDAKLRAVRQVALVLLEQPVRLSHRIADRPGDHAGSETVPAFSGARVLLSIARRRFSATLDGGRLISQGAVQGCTGRRVAARRLIVADSLAPLAELARNTFLNLD
jgi:hypothetical protein